MAQYRIPIIHLTSSNRLRIEMLQAHMPTKFKTLGSGAPLVAGDNNQVVICDAAEREKMIAAWREALEAMEPKPNLASNEARLIDSGNSSAAVQPLKDRDASGASAQQVQDARLARAGNQQRQQTGARN
jgi:hypothetical protein